MANIADLEMMTPGSCWLSNTERAYFVLFITNTALPAKVQSKHPPQVIYADEEGNVYNKSVDDFLASRKFHNVDGELEQRLNNLLQVPSTADEVEALDLDDETDAGEGEEGYTQEQVDAMNAAEEARNTSFQLGFFLEDDATLADPPLTNQELATATALYSQEPIIMQDANGLLDKGNTLHHFDIRLGGNITLESLSQSFDPAYAEGKNKLFAAFAISANGQVSQIEWNTFVGVTPLYTANGLYATLLLASDPPSFAAAPAEALEEAEVEEIVEEVAAEAVEQALADADAAVQAQVQTPVVVPAVQVTPAQPQQ